MKIEKAGKLYNNLQFFLITLFSKEHFGKKIVTEQSMVMNRLLYMRRFVRNSLQIKALFSSRQ